MTPKENPKTIRISQSSDWWSVLNEKTSEATINPQHREPSISNFHILGLGLERDHFQDIARQLGEATIVERGDGAAGRSQACYKSTNAVGNVYLIFEQGEVTSSYYLFDGGTNWVGEKYCASAPQITGQQKTESGLGLGLSQLAVERILGRPNTRSKYKLIYEFQVEKKTDADGFKRLRKSYPNQSEEELHKTFDIYTFSARIEARFNSSGLNYLVVSESEVY